MSRVIRAVALSVPLFIACARSAAEPTVSHLGTATEFVSLFTSGQFTAEGAKRLLGNGAAAERTGGFWQLRSADGFATIVVGARELHDVSEDAQLRLELEANVRLADLERVYGAWEPVAAGETSSVAFHVTGKVGQPVLVFVRLFASKPAPDSVVLSLSPRQAPAAAR